jgi:DNA replication protein DnaC
LLGPPGTGKTQLAIAISIRACLAAHHVAFAAVAECVARLGGAKRQGNLETELRRLGFGDDVVAAAMIDRLVHHADILALKGDSYRLRDRDLTRPPAAAPAP